jgi:hypothetical protein
MFGALMDGDSQPEVRRMPESWMPQPGDVSVISCDDCMMQNTSTCDDCVVTFICSREPDDAVVIDASEARAVHLLGEAGLVPPLQQVRRNVP